MVIVSDTSPISNMLIIGKLNLLFEVAGEIVIPPEVADEINALKKFNFNIEEFQKAEWITTKRPSNLKMVHELGKIVDPGEAEAIALALELNPEYIIIDEKIGRSVARRYKIQTTGLLGILMKAKQKKIVKNIKPIIDDLINIAGFWVSENLYCQVLKKVNE